MFRHTNTSVRLAKKTAKDAKRIAEERVRRGVEWLDQHAPVGWQRYLFDVKRGDNGKFYAIPRFNSSRNEEDVLALAFESQKEFTNPDGRASSVKVSDHFMLTSSDRIQMGFDSIWAVNGELIDSAWCDALTSYAQPLSGKYYHRFSDSEPPKPTWYRFGWLWRQRAKAT